MLTWKWGSPQPPAPMVGTHFVMRSFASSDTNTWRGDALGESQQKQALKEFKPISADKCSRYAPMYQV